MLKKKKEYAALHSGHQRQMAMTMSEHAKPAGTTVLEQARVLDAVTDQSEGYLIRYGTSARSYWFSLAELQTNERMVFSRLSGPGMTFLTPKSRNAFKQEIESHSEYRPSLVAARPGWVGGHYVFGDGSKISPSNDAREVIIAFQTNPKFTKRGGTGQLAERYWISRGA